MKGTHLERSGHLAVEASIALGRPTNAASRHKDMMRKVGFEYVVERQFKWPIGPWAKDKHYKEIGHWCKVNLDRGMEGLFMALLTRGLGWSKEEVYVLCALVREELADPKIHGYIPL